MPRPGSRLVRRGVGWALLFGSAFAPPPLAARAAPQRAHLSAGPRRPPRPSHRRDWPAARRALLATVRRKPRDWDTWYNLGIADEALSQDPRRASLVTEGIHAFRQALALRPGLPRAYEHLGVLYLRNGWFSAARAAISQAVHLAPRMATAWDNLGVALAKEGQWQPAQADFQQAVHLRPGFVRAQLNLQAAIARGRGLAALAADYRARARRRPDDAALAADYGMVLAATGDLPAAQAQLDRATRLTRPLPVAFFWQGQVERRRGHLTLAAKAFAAAARMAPNHFSLILPYAATLVELAKWRQALPALRSCVRLNPDSSRAHFLLARALIRRGDGSRGRVELERAARLRRRAAQRRDAMVAAQAAQFAVLHQPPAAALAVADRMLRRYPAMPEILECQAIALGEMGHADAARAAFRRALLLSHGAPGIHFNFGITLWHEGLSTSAIHEFRAALSIDPQNASARCALALSLLRIGQLRQGRRQLRRARAGGACQEKAVR